MRCEMILNKKQKIENAIAFFASEYKKARGYWPAQMWIYKLLALLDFRILLATGRPCLGLEYLAMVNGPVPQDLYFHRQSGAESNVFRFEPAASKGRFNIIALKGPNLDYFSDRAVEEMEKLSEEFIRSGKNLNDVVEATHNLAAWDKAWSAAQRCNRRRMLMEYADEFQVNPADKAPDALTWQEEAFLVYEKRREAELSGVE